MALGETLKSRGSKCGSSTGNARMFVSRPQRVTRRAEEAAVPRTHAPVITDDDPGPTAA